ncbi:hypothetical protein PQ455_14450 [Sphingomonas naphthae]|uniref:Uncharacterized protein n=1 Tax=Sphingomonas naphthae TaxID=1813468 RepID=A0ABY7THY3_9SPHN|nr:hypothetical protein [Sphingomonas naphthae]WCT72827.1 hypothetical protein PQ455_14450 [Sphingomonas naphthae]
MGMQHVGGRWSVVAQANRDRLLGTETRPLIATRWLDQVTIGVTRHFGR